MNTPDARDDELIRAGEHAELLARYFPSIVERLRARRALREGEVGEVAQRTCLRLLEELDRGKRYAVPFRVVVVNVTNWTLKDYWAARSEATLPEDWDVANPDDDVSRLESRLDVAARIRRAALPPREREVAELHFLEDLDPATIAERIGVERNAVDQALHRARRKLLERWDG